MALLDTNRTTYASAEILGHVGKFVADMINDVMEWNDARITRKSLGRLSDRELDDIGLTRAEIDVVAARR